MSGWWRRRQIKDLVHESLQILVDISRMCPIQKELLSCASVCFYVAMAVLMLPAAR